MSLRRTDPARHVAATMRVIDLIAVSGKRTYYPGLTALFRCHRQRESVCRVVSPVLSTPDRVRSLTQKVQGGPETEVEGYLVSVHGGSV